MRRLQRQRQSGNVLFLRFERQSHHTLLELAFFGQPQVREDITDPRQEVPHELVAGLAEERVEIAVREENVFVFQGIYAVVVVSESIIAQGKQGPDLARSKQRFCCRSLDVYGNTANQTRVDKRSFYVHHERNVISSICIHPMDVLKYVS